MSHSRWHGGLQLAHLCGARVITTVSSDDKARRVTELGADATINYRTTPDWHLAVRSLTGGRGVDQVIDIGGALEKSLRAVAIEGLVNFIGRLDVGAPMIDSGVIFNSIATVRVVAAGSRAQFHAMNRAISVARMRPVIDRVFGFDEVHDAFRYLESGKAFGKVVIRHRE